MESGACPTCGEVNPPAARLCGVCGTSLLRDEAAGEVRREITLVTSDAGQHVLLGRPVEISTVMEQNAPSQEVLVHESTYESVRDIVEVEAMDPVSPKGSDEKLAAYRLVSVQSRSTEAAAE